MLSQGVVDTRHSIFCIKALGIAGSKNRVLFENRIFICVYTGLARNDRISNSTCGRATITNITLGTIIHNVFRCTCSSTTGNGCSAIAIVCNRAVVAILTGSTIFTSGTIFHSIGRCTCSSTAGNGCSAIAIVFDSAVVAILTGSTIFTSGTIFHSIGRCTCSSTAGNGCSTIAIVLDRAVVTILTGSTIFTVCYRGHIVTAGNGRHARRRILGNSAVFARFTLFALLTLGTIINFNSRRSAGDCRIYTTININRLQGTRRATRSIDAVSTILSVNAVQNGGLGSVFTTNHGSSVCFGNRTGMSVRNQANLFFATEQFKAAFNLLGFAGSTVFTILAI